MDTLFATVAGLDVHLKGIQCAVRCRQESGKLIRQVRSFGTMTRDLRALADYLQSLGVTHVAMEATGVLWKPVWNVLEGRFTLLLVNPRHLKKVPGRKTDVTLVAVGHSLLVVIYHVLKDEVEYTDLGPDYFDRLEPERLRRYLVKRLQGLGYDVTLSPRTPDGRAA
jgi:hypothetical protein